MEEIKRGRGRPRKLKEEGTGAGVVAAENIYVTPINSKISISPVANSTASNADPGMGITYKDSVNVETGSSTYSWLIPWDGNKENLQPNQKKYFLNGKKLLYILKKKVAMDEQKNPVYRIMRGMQSVINDKKPEGKIIQDILRKRGIQHIGI